MQSSVTLVRTKDWKKGWQLENEKSKMSTMMSNKMICRLFVLNDREKIQMNDDKSQTRLIQHGSNIFFLHTKQYLITELVWSRRTVPPLLISMEINKHHRLNWFIHSIKRNISSQKLIIDTKTCSFFSFARLKKRKSKCDICKRFCLLRFWRWMSCIIYSNIWMCPM